MAEHQIVEQDGKHVCQVCGWKWVRLPKSPWARPGVPVWEWNASPEHLLTRRQLSEKGLTIATDAPPAGCLLNTLSNRKRGLFWIWLYDIQNARPKRPLTPAQIAAKERLAEKRRQARTCKRCGDEQEPSSALWAGGICHICHRLEVLRSARYDASEWAREKLADPGSWVVLDTETTGRERAEAVQIAVLNPDGQVLFDSLVRPKGEIEAGAITVHGITPEMVANAPTFAEIYERLAAAVAGKRVVAYNADFDRGVLDGDCRRHGLPLLDIKWSCAMHQYAKWYGEWSDYWEGFRWQELPGGDHSAAGDCRAVLDLMRAMARCDRYSEQEDPND